MKSYQHTQEAPSVVIAFGVSSLLLMIGAVIYGPLLLLAPVFVLAAWLFHSFTIEIADGELRWRFGPGWIRRHIALEEIVSASVVRAAGLGAVAIVLRNGKRFCLGTNEPEVLAALLSGGAAC